MLSELVRASVPHLDSGHKKGSFQTLGSAQNKSGLWEFERFKPLLRPTFCGLTECIFLEANTLSLSLEANRGTKRGGEKETLTWFYGRPLLGTKLVHCTLATRGSFACQ